MLTGYLAVDAEAGNEDGKPSADYGKMRLLELPRDSTVPGPGQVNNNFVADPDVSNELNILGRGDSQVVRGNLLTLPMGGGLLYVQPVYVQARSGTTFPLLQRVLVAFGDDIGFADTLDGALDQVFGGDSGADAGDAGTDPDAGTPDDAPTDRTDRRGDAGHRRPRRPRTPARTRPPAPTSTGRCSRPRRPSRTASPRWRATTSPPTARRSSGSTRPSRAPSRRRPGSTSEGVPAGGGDVRHHRPGRPRFGRP